MSDDRIWQIRLPDGSVWVPADSRPDDPRRSWIYARSTADMFAGEVGGEVVEVTGRQKEKLLDQEIASALTAPKPKTKTKTKAFNRSARRALATAILENVPLNAAARAAIDTARETADANEHKRALRTLKAGLPATLWISYDPKSARGHAQTTKPVWNDPQGEDSGLWRQIALEEIVSLLVEAL